MVAACTRLEKILNEVPSKLLQLTEEKTSIKPALDKWSKKEILGHLIDSAANNHQRFVRMQIENNLQLLQYKQDEWVAIQKYQTINWINLVKFWLIYNMHILHILKHVDETKLQNVASIENKKLTLQFIIDDYVDYMEHHLKEIFR